MAWRPNHRDERPRHRVRSLDRHLGTAGDAALLLCGRFFQPCHVSGPAPPRRGCRNVSQGEGERPVGIFLLFWAIVGVVAIQIPGLPDEAVSLALPVLLGPLWFLVVYIVLVALAPLMLYLHSRYRLGVIIVLGVLTVTVDLLRFVAEVPGIGWANFLFVWLFIHQLGFFYADGTVDRLSRRFFGLMAAGGYLLMIGLVQLETYPASMVGCCADKISNMAPPTLPIMALGIGQVGLAMLLRPSMTRWLARAWPWKAVVVVNSSIMTLFLWHISALSSSAATSGNNLRSIVFLQYC